MAKEYATKADALEGSAQMRPPAREADGIADWRETSGGEVGRRMPPSRPRVLGDGRLG